MFARFFPKKPPLPEEERGPSVRFLSLVGTLMRYVRGCEEQSAQAQAILNSLPRPIWLCDKNRTILWCNPTYMHMVGASSVAQVLEQQLEIAPHTTARVHVVMDGQRRVMDIITVLLPDFEATVYLALDNSREDELEREGLRHRAVYHELLENLRSAIGIYDAEQRLDFYNTAFAELWSLPEAWLATRPTLGEIMEKLRETRRLPEQSDFRRFKAAWLAMFTDLIEPYDDMLHLPDGSSFRFLVIPHPMGGLMMTFEDVTSRLALESSYNTLVAVQRETLDTLVEGVSVFGSNGRLRLWNPAFARLWGLHPETLSSDPHVSELVEKMARRMPLGSRDAGGKRLYELALERSENKGDFICADLGSGVQSHIAYATLPLPDGGVMITFRDVSDAVQAQQALREKTQALETAERLKLDFLANVSYQLRTPLSSMMGFADILEREYFGSLNGKQKEYMRSIREAGEDLITLIDDILDLSTLEAGYMELQCTPTDVRTLLEGLEALVQVWARKGRTEIVLECPKDIGFAFLDPQRIRQALLNLVRNALAYTPHGGRISLVAQKTQDGTGLILSVLDSGVGIAEEDKIRIFKPFERAAAPRGGAGLGLTLVKSIVDLHGGQVVLHSQQEMGTTIKIILPGALTKVESKASGGTRA